MMIKRMVMTGAVDSVSGIVRTAVILISAVMIVVVVVVVMSGGSSVAGVTVAAGSVHAELSAGEGIVMMGGDGGGAGGGRMRMRMMMRISRQIRRSVVEEGR